MLLLEDDALISLNSTDMIEQMGCRVRSYMRVEDGLAAVQEQLPDVGVLDINIRGRASYDLADWLRERNVTIVFVTGYDRRSMAIGVTFRSAASRVRYHPSKNSWKRH